MIRKFMTQSNVALRILGFLTLITGLIYPALVTSLTQVFFPFQANGSLILQDGQIIGSTLIGQNFRDPGYFHGRPSASVPAYNTNASSGSNLALTNPYLLGRIRQSCEDWRRITPPTNKPIPVDLVTASASGLDPDISPAAAYFQVPGIAKIRRMDEDRIRNLVHRNITPPQLGVLGEARVNVLLLNRALDALDRPPSTTLTGRSPSYQQGANTGNALHLPEVP